MWMNVKPYPETDETPAAPLTKQDIMGWRNLEPHIAIQRLGDWAAMLEERLAELDPLYQAHPWGRNSKSIWK